MSRFVCIRLCSLSSLLENRKIGPCKVPAYVLLLSLFAATGGLMFGYDIGVSGGVTVMDDFLCEFFPSVLEKKLKKQGQNDIRIRECRNISPQDWKEAIHEYIGSSKHEQGPQYCLFGDEKVQLFTSSLYLAAMASTCFAAYVSRHGGRKLTIMLAGLFYIVGVFMNIVSGAIPTDRHSVAFCVLIFGRVILGFGVGFGNQAIPLFISEIAPADVRGALNYLFQLNVTIGICFANIVNWKAQELHPWGWRLSLGLAGVPALLLMIGSFFLIESPSSLVQRGLSMEAQGVLGLIRGQGVNAYMAFQDILMAASSRYLYAPNVMQSEPPNDSMNAYASSVHSSKLPFNGLFARCNRPPLIITILVQFFQQFSGINVVLFYVPVLFKSFGSKTDESLRFTLIIGSCFVGSTLFSIFVVDRIGRRRLAIATSIVMLLAQLLIGSILINIEKVGRGHEILALVLVCVYVSAFACSWGPLSWLIATEIFPLTCRSEGQSVTVFFNMLFTFLIAHTALNMLCTFKFAIFFFFATWDAIMGLFSFFLLPETMNMEMEIIINYIWSYHRFWKHFVTCPPPPSRASHITHQIHSIVSPSYPYNQTPPISSHAMMKNININTLSQHVCP